jgi:hypothetical protein
MQLSTDVMSASQRDVILTIGSILQNAILLLLISRFDLVCRK